MKRIKEILDQMTKQGKIALYAATLLIGILIIGLVVFYAKNTHTWPLSYFQKIDKAELGDTKTDTFIDQAAQSLFTKEDVANGKYQNDIEGATLYANTTEEVQVAVVVDDTQYKIKDTEKISCGSLAFVTTRVVGPAVLNNTLKALFEDKIITDFMPGNIIPSYHPNLSFKNAVIENGVAKIYLGGSFSGSRDGVCDANLAITQISQTARTFSTVQSVEIYQGSEKIYSSK